LFQRNREGEFVTIHGVALTTVTIEKEEMQHIFYHKKTEEQSHFNGKATHPNIKQRSDTSYSKATYRRGVLA
jgi:hypothetical protein